MVTELTSGKITHLLKWDGLSKVEEEELETPIYVDTTPFRVTEEIQEPFGHFKVYYHKIIDKRTEVFIRKEWYAHKGYCAWGGETYILKDFEDW
jgi:hypothetical protein